MWAIGHIQKLFTMSWHELLNALLMSEDRLAPSQSALSLQAPTESSTWQPASPSFRLLFMSKSPLQFPYWSLPTNLMKISDNLLYFLRNATRFKFTPPCNSAFRVQQRPFRRPILREQSFSRPSFKSFQRRAHNAADREDFRSIVDAPPRLVKTATRKHGPGIYVLAAIPAIAFCLGCWQVQRLGWKTDLIARFEDRLVQTPLPLPPTVDPNAISDFDYRRVYAHGRYRHDQEMLIGPRVRDGIDGYLVVTPLEREGGCKILVNRGWISKEKRNSTQRQQYGRPVGEISVQGLLREPAQRNLFTPDNKPESGTWYFPDVEAMANATGSEPVWIEATMQPDLILAWDREEKGIPIGRLAEVNLRNNHTQYIFTWFSLSLATSIMLGMVLRKGPTASAAHLRRNFER